MSDSQGFSIDVYLDEGGAPAAMAEEVREGLLRSPKRISSKYFYDGHGSRLFERITELPEYYLTRAEQSLLEATAPEIALRTKPAELVELGPGSAKKTHVLIDAARAAGHLERYRGVEVSHAMVEQAAKALVARYPDLEVHAVVADFEADLHEIPPSPDRLVAFLGSTLGNFDEAGAIAFLTKVLPLCADGGHLLMGTDLIKETGRLEAAYNDSEGVTAAFNRNILNVLNRQLDGDLDPGSFEHVSYFNEDAARIETYLRSLEAQSARLEALDLEISFARGELVRTEVSCKYSRESVDRILNAAGFRLEEWYVDEDETYALSLSRPI